MVRYVKVPADMKRVIDELMVILNQQHHDHESYHLLLQKARELESLYVACRSKVQDEADCLGSVIPTLLHSLGTLSRPERCASVVVTEAEYWLAHCQDKLSQFTFIATVPEDGFKDDFLDGMVSPLTLSLNAFKDDSIDTIKTVGAVTTVLASFCLSEQDLMHVTDSKRVVLTEENVDQLTMLGHVVTMLASLGVSETDLLSLPGHQIKKLYEAIKIEGLRSSVVETVIAELGMGISSVKPELDISTPSDSAFFNGNNINGQNALVDLKSLSFKSSTDDSYLDSETEEFSEDQQSELRASVSEDQDGFQVLIHDSRYAHHHDALMRRMATAGGVYAFSGINRFEFDLFMFDLIGEICDKSLKWPVSARDALICCLNRLREKFDPEQNSPVVIDLAEVLPKRKSVEGISLKLQQHLNDKHENFERALMGPLSQYEWLYCSLIQRIEALSVLMSERRSVKEDPNTVIGVMSKIEDDMMRCGLPPRLFKRLSYRYGLVCPQVEKVLSAHSSKKRVRQLLTADSFGLRRYCKTIQSIRHARDYEYKVHNKTKAIVQRLQCSQMDLDAIERMLDEDRVDLHASQPRVARKKSRFFERNRRLLERGDFRSIVAETAFSMQAMKESLG